MRFLRFVGGGRLIPLRIPGDALPSTAAGSVAFIDPCKVFAVSDTTGCLDVINRDIRQKRKLVEIGRANNNKESREKNGGGIRVSAVAKDQEQDQFLEISCKRRCLGHYWR